MSSNYKAVQKQLEDMDREYNIWKQVSSWESFTPLTRDSNWLRLWDDAMDYGLPGATALEAFLRTLTIPVFGEYSCHMCGHKYNHSHPPAEHIAEAHIGSTLQHLLGLLTDPREETFTLAVSFRSGIFPHRAQLALQTWYLTPYVLLYFHYLLYVCLGVCSNELLT